MKKVIMTTVIVLSVWCVGAAVLAQAAPKNSGEKKFKELCAICHPDGGNIINPKKTLHKADREANNIKAETDIIKTMRKPGPGMTMFDEKTVPDKEAKEIAKYILMTFK